MYYRDETQWESADGTSYLIKDLTTPHLVNILNWMKKHEKTYELALYTFMESEAELRKFTAFVTNEPIPIKLEDGWYGLENITFYRRCVSMYYKYKTELKLALIKLRDKNPVRRKQQSIQDLKQNATKKAAKKLARLLEKG